MVGAAKYASFITLQQQKRQESALIIYDTSKKAKFYGFNPLQLLSYLIGHQPWAVNFAEDVDKYGTLAFVDTEWDRDDHAVIVKQRNKMDKQTLETVIDILAEELTYENIEIILMTMTKRMTTLEEKEMDEYEMKDMQSITKIEKSNVNEEFDIKTVKNILKIWFSNSIVGPFLITRSLSIHYVDDYDSILDPLTRKIQNGMMEDIFEKMVDHIVMLDERYFLISGKDAYDMIWPSDINCDFIAVTDETAKVEKENTKILKKFEVKYAEGLTEANQTKYRICVERGQKGKYLRLHFGGIVFYGVNNILYKILNSEPFNEWINSTEVKLELWFGRDEKNKIDDHRNLIKMNQELQLENERLKQEIEIQKKGNK